MTGALTRFADLSVRLALRASIAREIRDGDLATFDALRSQIVNDVALQAQYDAWLGTAIAQWQAGTGTLAECFGIVIAELGVAAEQG